MTDKAFTKAQVLRDLHWAISSPSLVSDAVAIGSQAIDVSAVDACELLNFMCERPGHRVGRYFENLVAFWLQHVRRVEMIGHGVQLREGKRTVGEIDFLFLDENGDLNHWEAAVKFFLHFPNPDGSHFPGPNATDNFELKTTKLFESQLEVSRQFYPDVKIRKAFIRGTIFYHLLAAELGLLPDRLAPNHTRGAWLRHSEIGELDRFGDALGFICLKPFWLAAPTNIRPISISQLQAQLQAHFGQHGYPLMVCLVPDSTSSSRGGELTRAFIVPDKWPDQ